MTFNELNIIEPVLRALIKEGYSVPTPIQEKAIPTALEGRDILGCAQTGTGKTAAFSIPVIQSLYSTSNSEPFNFKREKDVAKTKKRAIKALVLTPTRELASQIGDSFAKYAKFTELKHTVVYGGVSQRSQTEALKKGVDILVATPGRLLDLIGQGYVKLGMVEHFILDEADRMLDMGFIDDINRIITRIPANRQTMLFSATMPKEIAELADELLNEPVKIEISPVSSTVDTIDQYLYFTGKESKTSLLINLLENEDVETALIFSRTKHGADKISKTLNKAGINADSIHGNKSQNARQKSLMDFKKRKTKVLVATDIASRGIDINKISHVINFDLPEDPETYVHRIGRTGRAGYEGTALSFCDSSELGLLRSIQKLIGKEIDVVKGHDFECNICLDKLQPKPAKRENPVKSGRKRDYWRRGRRKSA